MSFPTLARNVPMTPASTYWEACSAPAEGLLPALEGAAQFDVLVIGAGYTGLSIALHAREAGLSVCVLEAKAPGHGASGRNAGQWLTGWVGKTPLQIETRYGAVAATRMNGFNVNAARLVFEIIEAHAIECAARQCGVLQVASSTNELKRLYELAEQWRRCGASISLLDKQGLARHLASDLFLGGIHYHDAGCLNPLAYTRGLARAATRAGAQIYCHSAVIELGRAGSEWQARTDLGRAQAKFVLIATDACSTPEVWRRLDRSFWRVSVPMLCSAALKQKGRDFLPQATPFAESRPGGLLFGGMLDASGRWVISAPPCARSTDRRAVGEWSLSRFRRVFPQVEPFEWECLWWGEIGVSRSALPQIFAIAERVLAVNGFSGGGIALATALGKAIARALAGRDWSELPIAPQPLASVPARRLLPAFLRGAVIPCARWIDERRGRHSYK